MWCPKCHTVNQAASTHCQSCAHDLRQVVSTEYQQTDLPSEEPNQFIAANYNYAGFWIRVFAALLDGIIIFFAYIGISIVFSFLAFSNDSQIGAIFSFFNLLGILMPWLYAALMESSDYRATFGKLALGIFVTDIDGNKISFWRATARHFGKIISSALLCIGFLMVAFTSKKQGLHDMIADCYVLRKP
ncbi:MAG: RDD family protein [Deltaproteobacteria bacterium]|nr:RDD family protein [Deltaproteobacteria bacterium]